jgi:SAM-dependent methyltransferase
MPDVRQAPPAVAVDPEPTSPVDSQRRPTRIWDVEWMRSWKAHPDNAWFAYEARVYLAQLAASGTPRTGRALKTDAFDEACGRRQLTAGLGRDVMVVDVSPRVVRQAACAGWDGITLAAADVRCLPFTAGNFDLVLSTSTLDHFDARADIGTALAELRRMLAADGRLLVTLDNPANPVLRLRRLIYALTGSIRAVIPFRMGLTLSRRRLVAAVERAELDVHESGYLVHAPRVVALWAGEWAARRGWTTIARRLAVLFDAIERVARRLPTRRWTAHFIFADCRPRLAGPGVPRVPPSRLPRWLTTWKLAEHRVRFAYLRTLPAPVLNRVDPPLRAAAGVVRRVAAVPVYLRHPLASWTGRAGSDTGRIAMWGAPHASRLLFDVLFDGRPTAAAGATYGLPAVVGRPGELAPDCDLMIAHTTPALAPLFRRAGFAIVPGLVRFGGAPAAVLAAAERRRSTSLAGDFRRLRRADYRVEHWTHTPERSRLFYHRYLVPHARARFRDRAELPTFPMVDRMFAAGAVVALFRRGSTEPDALGLVVPRADVLWCVFLGTRDADPAMLRAGAIAGIYLAQTRLAHARGARLVDFGRCVPWASNGIFQYKRKWGLHPIPDRVQTLEYAVKVLRPSSAVARRLVEHGVIVREGGRYRPFAAADLSV